MLNCEIEHELSLAEKNNAYIPSYISTSVKEYNCNNIIIVYRRNKMMEFIKGNNSVNIKIAIKGFDHHHVPAEQYLYWSDIE